MNKITHIKERILYIAKDQGFSKLKFFEILGVSSSGYREDNMDRPVVSDLLEKIVIKFNINAHWLLTGEGEMYQNQNMTADPEGGYERKDRDILVERLESELRKADKIIALLEKENDRLRKMIPKDPREKQPRAGRAS